MNENLKVYICAFKSEAYLHEAKICIKTLREAGKFTGEIYLFTDLISNLKNVNIVNIECSDIYNAAAMRLKFFEHVNTRASDIILYLDTDIMILKNLPDFKYIDDRVHVYGYNGEFGRAKRFQTESSFAGYLTNDINISEQHPFCSGILLFRPTNIIKNLFSTVCEHYNNQIKNNRVNSCWEQPALNLVLCEHNMYKISLNKYVHEERDKKPIHESVVFNHFCGMRGTRRASLMNKYINESV